MKKILLLFVACLALLSCADSGSQAEPKISVFAVHISTVAQQENISFTEAATKLRNMGYAGADVYPFQEESLAILDSLGYGHACTIVHLNYLGEKHIDGVDANNPREFFRAGWGDLEDAVLSFAKRCHFPRVMLVPNPLPQDATEEDANLVRSRIAAFADRCAAEGIDPVVESFDNETSLCYGTERLQAILGETKNLGVAFDIGNFTFAKEDPVEAFETLKDKVRHVHLKDRASLDDMTSVPAGTGCSKIETVLHKMQELGYDGWYTVEIFGSQQMLTDLEVAYRNTHAFLTAQ